MRRINRIPSSFFVILALTIILSPFLVTMQTAQATTATIGYTSTGGTYASSGADNVFGMILPTASTTKDGWLVQYGRAIVLAGSSGDYAKMCIWSYNDGELIATSGETLLSQTNSTAQFDFGSDVYLNASENYRVGLIFDTGNTKLYQASGAPSTYASQTPATNPMDYHAPTTTPISADGTVDWCIAIVVGDYQTIWPTPSHAGNYHWDGTQWIEFNDTEDITHDTVQWLPLLLLIVTCCGIGIYGAGAWGFFAGLNVALIIAYVFSLLGLWGIVLLVVVDAIALFGKAGMGGRSGKD